MCNNISKMEKHEFEKNEKRFDEGAEGNINMFLFSIILRKRYGVVKEFLSGTSITQ